MSVILEVPVVWRGRVIRRGHRRPADEAFIERIPVRVVEVGSERAPVAVRAQLAGGRVVAYREFAGGFVRPVVLPLMGDKVLLRRDNLDAALARLMTQAADGRFAAWPLLSEYYELPRCRFCQREDVRELQENDRDARIAATREAFQHGAAFIDGVLHVPSEGPAWVLSGNDGGGQRPELHEEWAREHGRAFCKADAFRWDALEAAKAAAASRNAEWRRYNGDDSGDETPLGYLVDQRLGAPEDGTLHFEVDCAARALMHRMTARLGTLSPEAIAAYAAMKASVRAGIRPDTAEHALEELRALHGFWLGERPRYGWRYHAELDGAAELLGRVPETGLGGAPAWPSLR